MVSLITVDEPIYIEPITLTLVVVAVVGEDHWKEHQEAYCEQYHNLRKVGKGWRVLGLILVLIRILNVNL